MLGFVMVGKPVPIILARRKPVIWIAMKILQSRKIILRISSCDPQEGNGRKGSL
jgi:hypothetical protein